MIVILDGDSLIDPKLKLRLWVSWVEFVNKFD